MNDLETRQLRYFVAVAEERHFGRAAVRLGVAQPSLSRAIRDLERQVGVRLLTRTTRQVALTPAGAVLLEDARVALDAIAAAGRRVRGFATPPALRLALQAECDGGLLPRMLDAYREMPVRLLLGARGEPVRSLHDGRADVALLPLPFDSRGLDVEPLLTSRWVVALSTNDPLAAQSSVDPADLAGRPLPDGTQNGTPAGSATSASTSTSAGTESASRMRKSETGSANRLLGSEDADGRLPARELNLSQTLSLVSVGRLVWILPEWAARGLAWPDVVYRPVNGRDPATLAVAWRSSSRSRAVAAFVRTAHQVADAAA